MLHQCDKGGKLSGQSTTQPNRNPPTHTIMTAAEQTAELLASIANDIARLQKVRESVAAGTFSHADIESLGVAAAGCQINAEDYTHLAK